MTPKQLAELTLLAALWGASFMFLRISVPEFGPFALVAVRVAIGAAVLIPLALRSTQTAALRTHWKPIALVGMLSTAVPFLLLSYTTLHATAGYTAILNAMAPIASAIIGFAWLGHRIGRLGIAGMAVGFAGVAVLAFDDQSLAAAAGVLPILAALGAMALYSVGANVSYRYLNGIDPLVIATGNQISATVLALPVALWFWPAAMPGALAWGSLVLLGVFCTSFALILYFRLLAEVGVARTVIVTYLIPVFGVFWGAVVLKEPVTGKVLAGGGLILAGIAMTSGLVGGGRRARAAPP